MRGLTEAVEMAELDMEPVAELIIDLGYTSNDFKLILSRLILSDMKVRERNHSTD
jgi:hypothetical protein